MMELFRLLQNEHMKVYRKQSTWIMLGIAFISISVVLLFFTLGNQQNLTFWEKVIDLFQTENQILYLIIIIVVSQIVSNEFSSGTAKILFIRPQSRIKIMIAKLLTTILFAILVMFVSLVSCLVIATISPRFNQVSDPTQIYHILTIIKVKLFTFSFYATLFFAISTLTRHIALSVFVGIFLMGSLQSLPSMIIFPETSFLISSLIWSIICIGLLIGSLIHFKKVDI